MVGFRFVLPLTLPNGETLGRDQQAAVLDAFRVKFGCNRTTCERILGLWLDECGVWERDVCLAVNVAIDAGQVELACETMARVCRETGIPSVRCEVSLGN